MRARRPAPLQVTDRPRAQPRRLGQLLLRQPGLDAQPPQQPGERNRRLGHSALPRRTADITLSLRRRGSSVLPVVLPCSPRSHDAWLGSMNRPCRTWPRRCVDSSPRRNQPLSSPAWPGQVTRFSAMTCSVELSEGIDDFFRATFPMADDETAFRLAAAGALAASGNTVCAPFEAASAAGYPLSPAWSGTRGRHTFRPRTTRSSPGCWLTVRSRSCTPNAWLSRRRELTTAQRSWRMS